MLTATGTESFKAPEILNGGYYDQQVDMWGAGCVLYTMLIGSQPFYEDSIALLHEKICAAEYPKEECVNWAKLSNTSKDLIKKLIEVDPEVRLTPEQALKHRFFWPGTHKK